MPAELSHTIVASRDQDAEARFVAEVLGLAAPTQLGKFTVVCLNNEVDLDFLRTDEVTSQHYAFTIGESEFDAMCERLHAREVTFFADPDHLQAGIHTFDDERSIYFDSPAGHNLEVSTRPDGSYGADPF